MRVYVSKDGQQYGPYTVEQLTEYVRQGHFTPNDYACFDGQNWRSVAEVPGFAKRSKPVPKAPVGAVRASTGGQSKNFQASQFEDNPDQARGKWLPGLVISVLLIVLGGSFWTAMQLGYNLIVATLIAVGSLVLSAFVVRAIRISHIRQILKQPVEGVPEHLQVQWKNDRLSKYAYPYATVGGVVALNTGETLFHLSRIDEGVLDAIYDFPKFNNLHDVVSHLQQHQGTASWSGDLSNFKGRFGEEVIADHLRAKGHVVEMAPKINQEDWDCLVDGKQFQIKSGLDSGEITKHLNKSDTHVLTVKEHAALEANYDNVTALEGVSGAEIQGITENTMDSSVDLVDFEVKLPIFTLVLSAARNFTPVFQGKSDDIGTALRYTVSDTVGIGVGGAAGAKFGALAGSLFGPGGTALGGILGGIGGTIVGKMFSDDYKQQALRKATATFGKHVSDYGQEYLQGLRKKAKHLNAAAIRLKSPFSLFGFLLPTVGNVIRNDARKAHKNWSYDCSEKVDELISNATPEGGTEPDFEAMGFELLNNPVDEPVFSPKIDATIKKVLQSGEKVKTEQQKLGYA
jgi:hypothetical protein